MASEIITASKVRVNMYDVVLEDNGMYRGYFTVPTGWYRQEMGFYNETNSTSHQIYFATESIEVWEGLGKTKVDMSKFAFPDKEISVTVGVYKNKSNKWIANQIIINKCDIK